MLDLRKLYGKVTIEGEDFGYNQNPGQQEKIFLEYYKTKKAQTKNEKKYGIEVIKKEENKNGITREKTVENGLSNNEKVIDKLLEILIENKVTPITTKDVITDLKLDPSMIYSRM